MPNHTTMNDLAWLRDVVSRMTPAPWLQLSGKYMAVDRGERPQVFRAWNAHDEEGVMVLRNTFDALLAVALRLHEVPHEDPNGGAVTHCYDDSHPEWKGGYAGPGYMADKCAICADLRTLHATLAAQRKAGE